MEPANIRVDRAGGTSDLSANPPAILESLKADIAYLEHRGIDCTPLGEAECILLCLTRHRIDAYIHFTLDNSRSIKPSLQEVFDIITFDRRVQAILLKYIGVFESKFRSIYSRLLSSSGGEFAAYDEDNFLRHKNYEKMRRSYDREMLRQAKNKALTHCMDERGLVPISTAVEYLSLGCLSKMYSNTASPEVTSQCARAFNVSKRKLSSWLRTLTAVRNCCAHFNPYVVRRQIPSTPLPMNGEENESREPFYAFHMLEILLEDEAIIEEFDNNLNTPMRIILDLKIDVSQFMWLFEFDQAVADYLRIPAIYRPVREKRDGKWGHVSAVIRGEFTPD